MSLSGPRLKVVDREDLRVGPSCDGCGYQLKVEPLTAPCPVCGSTLRRMPRLKGQAVALVIDVREERI
jgi:predicted Zn-ribbon and HTH transcriptional regulator